MSDARGCKTVLAAEWLYRGTDKDKQGNGPRRNRSWLLFFFRETKTRRRERQASITFRVFFGALTGNFGPPEKRPIRPQRGLEAGHVLLCRAQLGAIFSFGLVGPDQCPSTACRTLCTCQRPPGTVTSRAAPAGADSRLTRCISAVAQRRLQQHQRP